VQPLTPYLFVGLSDTYHSSRTRELARVFCALRIAMTSLEKFWDSLYPIADGAAVVGADDGNPGSQFLASRYAPYQKTFTDSTGRQATLEYHSPIEEEFNSVTFKAMMTIDDIPTWVVVKFTEAGAYGMAAHEASSDQGFAPKLYYAGEMSPGSQFWMVVMEFVEGNTLLQLKDKNRKVPQSFREELEAAVQWLHNHGFVFGDLRAQNIMINSEGKVKLIDFDWAGKAGEARYPLLINRDERLGWHKDVKPDGVIEPEHDLHMLKKL
jgi:serine/threonine protein kinase